MDYQEVCVKVKQYSIKACELTIESEPAFLAFAQKNLVLLQRYLLVIKGAMTPAIEAYLHDNRLSYTTDLNISNASSHEHLQKQSDLQIIDQIVRSGQEINVASDLLVLNRVNSGARIRAEGNLIITDVVDGLIECNGEFMLIKTSPKALVVFNGATIEGSMLHNKFHKIRFNGEEIVMSPIKKEPKWA